MHSSKTLAAAALALVTAACNSGQPTLYKVAVDMSALNPVRDASCYYNMQAPTDPAELTNLRTEQQWVVWDAQDEKGGTLQYLDPGHQSAKMGNSPGLDFNNAIETNTPGTFNAQVKKQTVYGDNVYTEIRTVTLNVTFANEGASPTGKLEMKSEYGCSPMEACPQDYPGSDYHSCDVTMDFTARRIDASRIDGYTDVGNAGTSSNLGSSSSGTGT